MGILHLDNKCFILLRLSSTICSVATHYSANSYTAETCRQRNLLEEQQNDNTVSNSSN